MLTALLADNVSMSLSFGHLYKVLRVKPLSQPICHYCRIYLMRVYKILYPIEWEQSGISVVGVEEALEINDFV